MWNLDAILRIGIYLLMIVGLGYGLYSKRLLRYVAPRSIKYVSFMMIVLSGLFVMEFRNLRRIREKKLKSLDYLFFLIPLLLAFTTAPVVVKGSALKTTASQISRNIAEEDEGISSLNRASETFMKKAEEPISSNSSVSVPEESSATVGLNETKDRGENLEIEKMSETTSAEGSIEEPTLKEIPDFSAPVEAIPSEEEQVGDEFIEESYPLGDLAPITPPKDGEVKEVDESNYFAVMMSIEEEGDKWNGKKIEISGFVYRDETLSKSQFLLVRMLMKCCAADMEPLVLLSVLPEGMQMPKNDEWFVVRGTLRTKPIVETGLWVPTLDVEVMAPISEPEKSYIDPIYNG